MITEPQASIIAGLRIESARLYQQAAAIEFDAQDLAYQAEEMEIGLGCDVEIGDRCIGCRWYHTKNTIDWNGACGKHVTIKRCLSMDPCVGIVRSGL